ncbi:hypothetical protein LOK49_LG06G02870 [Camellia lanceoleosa]|uniref:Uncharacterized protein n=1 Tax=Camellia lanceoleosa TaxID=1840588 RepID=A0ACC0HD89_9ERIC|nr:hypothetical protein LOK49_LG06G02870 [Camellia lanceoleosa]
MKVLARNGGGKEESCGIQQKEYTGEENRRLRKREWEKRNVRDKCIVPSPQHSTSRMISSLQHPMCNLDLWSRSKGSSSNQDSAIDVSDFSGPPSFQSTEMSCENLDYSLTSHVSRTSGFSQTSNELQAEMRRLRDQLKQMMEMYNSVCKEAFSSKEKEIDEWKPEEERNVRKQRKRRGCDGFGRDGKTKTKVAIEATDGTTTTKI